MFKILMIKLIAISISLMLLIPIEILIIAIFKLGQIMSIVLSIALEIITTYKVVKISDNITSTDK